jgi:hypothetical protein
MSQAAERPVSQPLGARSDSSYHILLLTLCGGVLLLAFILSIRGQTQVVLPLVNVPLPELCMSRRTFGIPCPGCGLTRCFISLARGDAAAAWSYNPAGLLLFAIIAFQVPFRAWQLFRIRHGRPEVALHRTAYVALVAVAVIMVGQWALRLMGVPL